MRAIATSLLFATSSLIAEDCCIPEYVPGEPLCDACAIYSAYAGPELECAWNIFTFGELLYWTPVRATCWVDLTFEGVPLGSQQLKIAHKFGYRPAFRVGLGMSLRNFDDWMMSADYIWYHHSFKKTDSITPPNFITSTVGFFNAPIYSSIRNQSDFNYDIVGIRVQRPNYLGQTVILSPFLGLKWLNRNMKIEQNLTRSGTTLVDRQYTTVSYSSIGASAGMDGYWLMCWGFYLLGKADVAMLYAYDRKKNIQVGIAAEGTVQILEARIKHADIWGKGGLGLGWGSYFCCNRYHFNLEAQYDFMVEVVKLALNSGMFQEPLTMLHGVTLHAQFDF
ncbi:MAG: hypothetical protein JSS30_03110 [Verrucomicrobia bacterium]|nr:hypothetical protein [Verrucomicrobiota bacterium]